MLIALVDIANLLLTILTWVIIIQVVLSWLLAFNVLNTSSQGVRTFAMALDRITAPLYRPIRKILPDFGNGSARLVYVLNLTGDEEVAGRTMMIDAHSGQTIVDLSHALFAAPVAGDLIVILRRRSLAIVVEARIRPQRDLRIGQDLPDQPVLVRGPRRHVRPDLDGRPGRQTVTGAPARMGIRMTGDPASDIVPLHIAPQ